MTKCYLEVNLLERRFKGCCVIQLMIGDLLINYCCKGFLGLELPFNLP